VVVLRARLEGLVAPGDEARREGAGAGAGLREGGGEGGKGEEVTAVEDGGVL